MAVLIRKFVFFWVQVQQRLLVLCNALCTIIEREGMQPSRIAYLVHNTDKSLFIGCPDNLFRKFIEFPHYSSCGTSHHSTTSIQSAPQSLPVPVPSPSASFRKYVQNLYFYNTHFPISSLASIVVLLVCRLLICCCSYCCTRRFTITNFNDQTEDDGQILRSIWKLVPKDDDPPLL